MQYIKIDNNGVVTIVSSSPFYEAIEIQEHISVKIGMIYKDGVFTKNFEDLKQEKLESLNTYVNAQFKAYLGKYPDVEVQSFTVKSAEAARIAVNPETPLSDTPYLSALTNNDLTARNELAEAVNAKVKENAELEAFAVQTRDAIKACKTQEELTNVTW